MFAHNQAIAADPYGLWRHDLISLFVLEYPVLMNTRLMGKSILADDRFIDRDRDSSDLRYQA